MMKFHEYYFGSMNSCGSELLCFKKYDDVIGAPEVVSDLYVLALEDGKYYVGKTNNLEKRIEEHRDGEGSIWTKKYAPINVVQIIHDCGRFDEDNYTKSYMKKYGINNVRGGSYTQIKLSNEQINLLETEIKGLNDECFKCGKKGHFAKDCGDETDFEEESEDYEYEMSPIFPDGVGIVSVWIVVSVLLSIFVLSSISETIDDPWKTSMTLFENLMMLVCVLWIFVPLGAFILSTMFD